MNNLNTSSIESVVLARVRTIYTLRIFLLPTVISSVLLVLAVWGIGREVWVAHVLQNMPSLDHVDALVNFVKAAFLNTRFAVQVLVLAVFTAVLWLAYNLSQVLRAALLYR